MRPRMTVVAAVTMALSLGLAGCGDPGRDAGNVGAGSQPGANARGPGLSEAEIRREDATVGWADNYCGAVSNLVRSFSDMPDIDPSSPERTSRSSSKLLGVMIHGLDRTLNALDRLDRAPLPVADKIKSKAVKKYTEIRDSAVGAKQQLDAAEGDQENRAAISSVRAPLEEVGRINLLDGFSSLPSLERAAAKAPACLQLTKQGKAKIGSS